MTDDVPLSGSTPRRIADAVFDRGADVVRRLRERRSMTPGAVDDVSEDPSEQTPEPDVEPAELVPEPEPEPVADPEPEPIPEPQAEPEAAQQDGADQDSADQDAEPEKAAAAEKPVKPSRVDLPKSSRTFDRWGMHPEDRARVMEQCLLLQRSGWKSNFALMMTAAVVVAIMGLLANSAAVVIGAMLIAPLMTPVLGIAASIAMALGPALARSIVTVAIATVGAIGMGFVSGMLIPHDGLSAEILARTQPDIKDLFVAIAAGIAGSYATARPDTSSSLPGVAIAVALVPPLAVVGLVLQDGEFNLALGALLLYITNLAAIIFMSALVFIVTGFVPGRRLLRTAPQVVLGAIGALCVLVVVGWLLYRTTVRTSDQVQTQRAIEQRVDEWIAGTGGEVEDVSYDDSGVQVEVSSINPPPSAESLKPALQEAVGEDVNVSVLWRPLRDGGEPIDVQIDPDEVRSSIDGWIAGTGEVASYDVQASNRSILVNLTGPESLVGDATLREQLEERFGVPAIVEFAVQQTAEEKSSTELTIERINAQVEAWANERDLDVVEVEHEFDAEQLTSVGAVVRGPTAPTLESLIERLDADEDFAGEVELFFSQELPVGLIPTPTAIPTPTPVPTPAPTPDPDTASTVELDFPTAVPTPA